MMNNELPDTMKSRDFRIISDSAGGYKPIDAITQFKYKGYIISISTAGRSIGACSTEIGVFEGDMSKQIAWCSTVEEAIEWIDGRVADIARTDYSTQPPLGNNRQRKILELAKEHSDVYAVRLLTETIQDLISKLEYNERDTNTLLTTIRNAALFNEDYIFSGFTTESFNPTRRMELGVHKISEYFVQLECLLNDLGIEVPHA